MNDVERKKARMAESRARIDDMVTTREEASTRRLVDVIETSATDAETVFIEEFSARLRDAD